MSRLINDIKREEGFRAIPYDDTLGYATAGIGTKLPFTIAEVELIMRARFDVAMAGINEDGIKFQGDLFPISEAEAEMILQFRLNQMISALLEKKPIVLRMTQERQEVIFNAMYQLGVSGILKFKLFWAAIEEFKFQEASQEMILSRWHSQTPGRVERLAKIMRG